jgi:hypothetical protein
MLFPLVVCLYRSGFSRRAYVIRRIPPPAGAAVTQQKARRHRAGWGSIVVYILLCGVIYSIGFMVVNHQGIK